MRPRYGDLHLCTVAATLLLAAAFASPTLASEAATARVLAEAEQLAIEGRHAAAVDAYRSLLAQGVDTVGLRYNLGTLLLQEGELGPAVLHLETAISRDPRFEDARYNLEAARRLLIDHIDVPAERESILSRFVAQCRTNELAWFFLFCVALLSGTAAALPWTSQHPRGRRLCTLGVVGALVLTVSSVALLWERLVNERTRRAVVVVTEVEAKVAPTPEAAPSFVAHAGLSGTIVDEESGYLRLRLATGLDAWFPKSALGEFGQR